MSEESVNLAEQIRALAVGYGITEVLAALRAVEMTALAQISEHEARLGVFEKMNKFEIEFLTKLASRESMA